MGVARVVLLHAWHHRVRTLLLAAAVSVALALPIAARLIAGAFEADLRSRASTVPVLVGAAGSRFDLAFTALYHRLGARGTIPIAQADRMIADGSARMAVPMHARFTARGEPVVCAAFEYFRLRGLTPAQGRLPATAGEVVLGSGAAARLGLGDGDELSSDQPVGLDITGASSIVLRVVGVLAETGEPDDDAVFADLSTAWILEGISHGHADAETIVDPESVLGRSDDAVALSGAVNTLQEITSANAESFHVHGDPTQLPVTAVLVYPASAKDETILLARYNASPAMQAVRPAAVVDELVSFVVRLRTVFDAVASVLIVTTVALVTLITALSLRIREAELRTLAEIGVSRPVVAMVTGGDLLVIGGIACALAAAEVGLVVWLALALLPG